MAYTNSSMVVYTKLSPNHSGQRTMNIDRISPHCVVGQCTAEGLGDWFARSSTQASSNYGIDKDGRVGMYVEEKNRSWCTSSNVNDQRAITIECASDTKEPYTMYDVVYQTLIKLCVDICQRYGKKKLLWLSDKDKTLAYTPASDEMIITVHRWFANKSCPGEWLYSRLGDLASKVTAALDGTTTTTEPAAATNNEKAIWDYLYGKIGNAYGVAGLMGNLYAESALRPNNCRTLMKSRWALQMRSTPLLSMTAHTPISSRILPDTVLRSGLTGPASRPFWNTPRQPVNLSVILTCSSALSGRSSREDIRPF